MINNNININNNSQPDLSYWTRYYVFFHNISWSRTILEISVEKKAWLRTVVATAIIQIKVKEKIKMKKESKMKQETTDYWERHEEEINHTKLRRWWYDHGLWRLPKKWCDPPRFRECSHWSSPTSNFFFCFLFLWTESKSSRSWSCILCVLCLDKSRVEQNHDDGKRMRSPGANTRTALNRPSDHDLGESRSHNNFSLSYTPQLPFWALKFHPVIS